jgi:putative peptide zinc metalloprotease protein
VQLLRNAPAFASLPAPAVAQLAESLHPEYVPAGLVIVAEGAPGHALYLIAEGRAEVTTQGPAEPVLLATLEPGELFGEVALLIPEATRQATVTALTPMVLLSLHRSQFERLLDQHPELRANLAQVAESVSIANFLKRASPFTALDVTLLRQLASQVERCDVPAGRYILRQGERGDSCYLLQRGRVEVLLRRADGPERRLQTLGPGALFGEAALLTEAPRNASVRALEPSRLLVLHRADLLTAMRADSRVAIALGDLLHMHALPRRAERVIIQHRTTSEGDTVTILKDPQRGAYYRLSPQGWFLWQRMDGSHNLRDLTLDYFTAFKTFAPGQVVEVVGGLLAAGFAEVPRMRADIPAPIARLPWWQRAALVARRVLTYHVSWRGVDGVFSRLYQGGLWLCYTWVGQLLLALICLAGLTLFVTASGRMGVMVQQVPAAHTLWWLIPGYLIMVLVHEAAHAVTTKAFGYEVLGVGAGWYWFGPFAYVDTTDMWLADRWPRIAVSLAGPYSTLLLGCIAVLASQLSTNVFVTVALWQFALLAFVSVLVNLNPLLEYDGYFVLVDLLDRPNLRPKALAWLGREFGPALRTKDGLRGHGLDLVYGFGSLLYTLGMAGATVVVYRLYLQAWFARIASAEIASVLAWLLSGIVVLLSVLAITGDLRWRTRRPSVA